MWMYLHISHDLLLSFLSHFFLSHTLSPTFSLSFISLSYLSLSLSLSLSHSFSLSLSLLLHYLFSSQCWLHCLIDHWCLRWVNQFICSRLYHIRSIHCNTGIIISERYCLNSWLPCRYVHTCATTLRICLSTFMLPSANYLLI